MYKQQIDREQLDRLKRGDRLLLLELLKASDKTLMKELKTPNCNVSFLQGASHVVDRLINVLEINP